MSQYPLAIDMPVHYQGQNYRTHSFTTLYLEDSANKPTLQGVAAAVLFLDPGDSWTPEWQGDPNPITVALGDLAQP